MKRLAIVSLDFTNTLVKFRHAPPTVYARVALEHGVQLRTEDVDQSFRTSFKKVWSDHPNFGRESIGSRKFWHNVVSSTLTGAGYAEHLRNEKSRTRISDHLYEAFATEELWKLNDSCIPVLERLKTENVKLIVISNMDERLEAILKSLRIRDYFDVVLSSYETGITKPDRRIFDCALARVDTGKGCVARSAVHIGDDFDKDYNGARNAGWNALWLNEREESKQIPSEFVVTSLLDVPQKINQINANL